MTNQPEAVKACRFCNKTEFIKVTDECGEKLVTCQKCEASTWLDVWNSDTAPAAPVGVDAVGALGQTLKFCKSDLDPYAVLSDLSAQGYTLRRDTMSEADMAREALQIAENYTVAKPSMLEHAEAICDLAKKFRG